MRTPATSTLHIPVIWGARHLVAKTFTATCCEEPPTHLSFKAFSSSIVMDTVHSPTDKGWTRTEPKAAATCQRQHDFRVL
jgi:hypothetical protein